MSHFRILTLASAAAFAAFGIAQPAPKHVAGEIVVKFRPGSESSRLLVHAANRATVKTDIRQIGFQLVKLPAGMSVNQGIALYESNPLVEVAEPNYVYQKRLIPNDPNFSQQYGALQMRLPQAWDVTTGSNTVIVAIIDDGVDYSHPDLAGNTVPGKDYIDGDSNPTPGHGNEHGTHCAGIAGAVANNGVGVAGMGWNCRLMGIRFNYTTAQSAEAIIWATNNNAKVINMSYGAYGPPPAVEEDAVNYAWSQGVLLVSAAGNVNTDRLDSWPDGFENVISVGATNQSDAKANFSDFGPRVDVAAPGVNIYSTLPGNRYGNSSGTSMSSPGVCGVAGLLFAYGGSGVTNAEVREALEETSDFVGTWLVNGRVNAEQALTRIRPLIDVPVVPSDVSVVEGAYVSGNAASVANSDNSYYVLAAAAAGRVGTTASAAVEFTIPFDPLTLRDASIRIEAAATSGATNLVFFWDWNQNKYVSYRQFRLTGNDTTVTVPMGTGLRTYIKNGKVRMLTRALLPARRGSLSNYNFKLDQVRLDAKVQS